MYLDMSSTNKYHSIFLNAYGKANSKTMSFVLLNNAVLVQHHAVLRLYPFSKRTFSHVLYTLDRKLARKGFVKYWAQISDSSFDTFTKKLTTETDFAFSLQRSTILKKQVGSQK